MEQVASGYGLIEGPVWDAARGLYFSDVLNGGVNLLAPGGGITQVVPRRRGVGGMALHENGGLIVSGRDISYVPLAGGEGRILLAPGRIEGAIGFNDLTTDAAGRIFAGAMAFRVFGDEQPTPSHLCRIDLDGSMTPVADGVLLTNGLGFSPDGTRLYHSDSRAELVRVYDVGPAGALGPWRTFAKMVAAWTPDGLKVAADGAVWVADASGGRVAVFEPDGSHRMDLAAPLPMVTSLCFGGEDLCDLYVVTGSRGGPSENCAAIFKIRVETPGLPLPPARVLIQP